MRDGEQIGPFSKDAAQILIRQGSVSVEDLAWRKGTEQWVPLGEVLSAMGVPVEPPPAAVAPAEPPETPESPAAVTAEAEATPAHAPEPPAVEGEPAAPATPEPATPSEPATPGQLAFLNYFGIAPAPDLTKAAAETLILQASEDPQNTRRLASWEVDRFRLHPDLFNLEVEEQKSDRVQFYFDLCQTAGSDHFTGVTKAHCQVLLGFLDVNHPRWDANPVEATERYFFPALAEKFPQLVNRAWRVRAQPADPSSIKARAMRGLPTIKLEKRPASFWVAVLRGFVLGLFILVVLYGVHFYLQFRKEKAADGEKTGALLVPRGPSDRG